MIILIIICFVQDSDSDKELEQDVEERGNEDERNNPGNSPEIVVRQRKSRFRDAESPEAPLINNECSPPSQSIVTSPVKRSREEILQDVVSNFLIFFFSVYFVTKILWI